MELSKNYIPSVVEDKWYKHWIDKRYFNSEPDGREAFTVVIPPPNVTGVLHMGHTLNETVQDILVRRARMSGKNTCWVPGSDHASIATEARVVAMLKERGIDKKQLTRPEFMEYAYEWKEKYGGIIYSQIRKLGCSVDWDRVSFTMDTDYYKAVIAIFINLFEKGLIYRGARMINWDPQAKTALSDEEVEYRDEMGKLYYVAYPIIDAAGHATGRHISIATQRPETIMGDTAVCVNPSDERYKDLAGAFALVPLVNRRVPIIFDDYVDPAFGTGALKVTPAHDINDYNLGLKHSLPIIDTLNEDGTLSAAAEVFVGIDRFAARKKVIQQLEADGLLQKVEEHPTRLGFSQRTNAVVEPRISTQWFVKMAAMAEPALKAVTEGYIHIHPGDKYLATYKYWLENVKDWCISRQLWWGQQIPAWYAPDGSLQVAATREEAFAKFGAAGARMTIDDLRQDEDVLDTWFSSWLWPIEVFKGITQPGNPDINYYYPTSVLVTGQDIIFFWVARMIMAGLYYFPDREDLPMEKRIPFRDVYFTGMVRDKQGRKMSKSLGNSPDLLELIDKYGADAVRFGIMISSPAGNDLLFDEAALEQGRNFNNKLWNALKLVKMWEAKANGIIGPSEHFAVKWFEYRLSEVSQNITKLINEFRLSEALKTLYSLIWDDFCSWYLEWVKPPFDQSIERKVYEKTIHFFEELIQLLHPFMPFITEEIYHLLGERTDDLCVKQFTPIQIANVDATTEIVEIFRQLIPKIREFRTKAGKKKEEQTTVYVDNLDRFPPVVCDLILGIANAKMSTVTVHDKENNGVSALNLEMVLIGTDKFYLDPGNLEVAFTGAIKSQLTRELTRLNEFLNSLNKKLENERFINSAKGEVIENERKKKEDTEIKIKAIEESLSKLA
jgi:valyl-tRNA synthetase